MLTPEQISNIIQPIKSSLFLEKKEISELLYDSRKLEIAENTLFFAIVTTKNNGHQYIKELYKQNVLHFVISEPIEKYQDLEANFYQVEDTVLAMQQLAAAHRQTFDYNVVGITGSNGKTIIKEWLANILAKDFSVIKNPNSFNSQIGVPLSVWRMNDTHNFGIFEAGISKPNEMANLQKVIQPTIGILTNIGNAHSAFFKDDKEKLIEKLKLFEHSKSIVFNNDDELIREELLQKKYDYLQKISWGFDKNSYYRISSKKIFQHATIVEFANIQEWLEIPFTDAASIENVLHISALLMSMGYSLNYISMQLKRLAPVEMRMEIKEALNQSIIINDTYSLDINSLRVALDFLANQTQFKKKTLIISDFEHVNWKEEDYKNLSKIFDNYNITKMIVVGKELRKWHAYFPVVEKYFYTTTNELLADIDNIPINEEAVLIKGARTYRFERIVQALQLKTHSTILQVDLAAIIHNLHYFKKLLNPKTKIMAMVKAMSYGLGDAELINELCYHHVDYLAVAYTDEGIALRKRNITVPIVVLGAEATGFEQMIRYNLQPEIYNLFYLKELVNVLKDYPEINNFPIHIKVDTGMHRLGFDVEEIDEMLQILNRCPQLHIASVFSHLASAEDIKGDIFSNLQIFKYNQILFKIDLQIPYKYLKHILNTAGIVRFNDFQFDMVRLGLGLYGFVSLPETQKELQSVVTLKSVITQIKSIKKGDSVGYNRTFIAKNDLKIAIVPVGYADGFPRELSNGVGFMRVKNVECKIVGKICMDMTMIDVTNLEVEIGDEVLIYDAVNSIDKVATSINKTPYELMTSITKRVPRVYVRE